MATNPEELLPTPLNRKFCFFAGRIQRQKSLQINFLHHTFGNEENVVELALYHHGKP